MIRLLLSRTDLWSDYPQTEVTSDRTIVRLKGAYDYTIPIRMWPLIISFPSKSDPWSHYSHPEATPEHTIPIRKRPLIIPFTSGSDLWSYHSHPEVTSDHTIPIQKWPLITLLPSAADLWLDHSHPQVTYDQTIAIRNQNPDPVIIVWEHTLCVGPRMIRGHFRMAPQRGLYPLRYICLGSRVYLADGICIIFSDFTDRNVCTNLATVFS